MRSGAATVARGLCALALLGLLGARLDEGETLERTTREGPVEVRVRLAPAAPVIGDPLVLELEARAEPGVELLMPEFGEALDRFRIVDFAPRETVDADGRTRAVQRYTLEAPLSGRHRIPPLLVEFVDRRPGHDPAPEGLDAYEVLTERIDFEVASVAPADAGPELRPLPGPLALAAETLPRWVPVVAALAALAAAGGVAVWLRARRSARRRRRSAWEVAWEELGALEARPRPGPGEMDAFYVSLSGIIRRYVEARFELRSPELTTEEFFEEARRSPELARAAGELLREFLVGADLVKFARHRPSADEVEAALRAARRIVEATRELEEPAKAAGGPLAEGAAHA